MRSRSWARKKGFSSKKLYISRSLTFMSISRLEDLDVCGNGLLIAYNRDPSPIIAAVGRRVIIGALHLRGFFLESRGDPGAAFLEREHDAELTVVLKYALEVVVHCILHPGKDLLRYGVGWMNVTFSLLIPSG